MFTMTVGLFYISL